MEEQFSYQYPYLQSPRQKMKFTVSELKKRAYLLESGDASDEAWEMGEVLYEEPEVVPLLPAFLKEEEPLTGASRGTAYHRVMELLDFAADESRKGIEDALENWTEQGKMTKEMAACIRPEEILKFLESSCGRRMKQAAGNRRLYREQPFVLGIEAGEVYPQEQEGELLLVQGIIDVWFEEEDGLVVLDYKTDQVDSPEELTEKYHAQLDYYARALEQLTGKKVKEKIIYSFTLKQEIRLP